MCVEGLEQDADPANGLARSRYCTPRTAVLPAVGFTSPRIARIVVDFPRAVRPEEAGHSPGLDGERQVVDGEGGAEPLRERFDLDHCSTLTTTA